MIPYGRHHIDEEDIAAVTDVLRNKSLTQGSTVEAFETAVASYVGAKYAVAVSSCTAALHMCAVAAGVTKGKKLVTTPITFVSTSNSAFYAGGTPVFSDIDPNTINLCPDTLQKTLSVTENVAAIVPVHFGGLPCEMERIQTIAASKNAIIFEDAAHAIGATYADGQRVGCCSNSVMTAFSFHPVKQIAAGEGGMITTNDENIYRFLLRFRSHGINKLDDQFKLQDQAFTDGITNPWYHEMHELGMHYRITDFQCALGISQLRKLDKFIERRRELARRYDDEFLNREYVRPAQPMDRDRNGLHLYALRINYEAFDTTRAKFMLSLREKNIVCQVHYNPVTSNPYYKDLGFDTHQFPNAMAYYDEALSIPLYYDLSDSQQSYVIECLNSLLS